ncbi:hypothetical protein RBWH47_05144 [Rhodopirellula baltica WH47]|uniref:Uncharacterized protein n=1 Tax=Rhodopirellula baltica WH47 TaxID=991778 RepID=F2AQ03_RHOBT|nr:hypothetical protein RBWH47_05144 [Rhodopirellula baltica WH47]
MNEDSLAKRVTELDCHGISVEQSGFRDRFGVDQTRRLAQP